jgi:hypothetical protein
MKTIPDSRAQIFCYRNGRTTFKSIIKDKFEARDEKMATRWSCLNGKEEKTMGKRRWWVLGEGWIVHVFPCLFDLMWYFNILFFYWRVKKPGLCQVLNYRRFFQWKMMTKVRRSTDHTNSNIFTRPKKWLSQCLSLLTIIQKRYLQEKTCPIQWGV